MGGLRRWAVFAAVVCHAGCNSGAKIETAQKATGSFYRQMAAKDYAGIYEGSREVLGRKIGKADFVRFLQVVEQQYGECSPGAMSSSSVDLEPGGTIVRLVYRSQCGKGERVDRFAWLVRDEGVLLSTFSVDPGGK